MRLHCYIDDILSFMWRYFSPYRNMISLPDLSLFFQSLANCIVLMTLRGTELSSNATSPGKSSVTTEKSSDVTELATPPGKPSNTAERSSDAAERFNNNNMASECLVNRSILNEVNNCDDSDVVWDVPSTPFDSCFYDLDLAPDALDLAPDSDGGHISKCLTSGSESKHPDSMSSYDATNTEAESHGRGSPATLTTHLQYKIQRDQPCYWYHLLVALLCSLTAALFRKMPCKMLFVPFIISWMLLPACAKCSPSTWRDTTIQHFALNDTCPYQPTCALDEGAERVSVATACFSNGTALNLRHDVLFCMSLNMSCTDLPDAIETTYDFNTTLDISESCHHFPMKQRSSRRLIRDTFLLHALESRSLWHWSYAPGNCTPYAVAQSVPGWHSSSPMHRTEMYPGGNFQSWWWYPESGCTCYVYPFHANASIPPWHGPGTGCGWGIATNLSSGDGYRQLRTANSARISDVLVNTSEPCSTCEAVPLRPPWLAGTFPLASLALSVLIRFLASFLVVRYVFTRRYPPGGVDQLFHSERVYVTPTVFMVPEGSTVLVADAQALLGPYRRQEDPQQPHPQDEQGATDEYEDTDSSNVDDIDFPSGSEEQAATIPRSIQVSMIPVTGKSRTVEVLEENQPGEIVAPVKNRLSTRVVVPSPQHVPAVKGQHQLCLTSDDHESPRQGSGTENLHKLDGRPQLAGDSHEVSSDHSEERCYHSQDDSSLSNEDAQAIISVPSKVSWDGHKGATSLCKVKVREESGSALHGVPPPPVTGVSTSTPHARADSLSQCSPNPPPNPYGVCVPASTLDVVVVDVDVSFFDNHGLGVHGCNMGPATIAEDIELVPSCPGPGPVHSLPDPPDEVEGGIFDCTFDHTDLMVRPFRGQYGEPNS